jgi:hypothetical protein
VGARVGFGRPDVDREPLVSLGHVEQARAAQIAEVLRGRRAEGVGVAYAVPGVGGPEPATALLPLTSWARARSIALTDLSVVRPSLEEVYLELIAGARSRSEEVAVP